MVLDTLIAAVGSGGGESPADLFKPCQTASDCGMKTQWNIWTDADITHVTNGDQFLPQRGCKRGEKSINADSILTGVSREPETHQTLLLILFVRQSRVTTAEDVPLILAHPHQWVFIIVENVTNPAEPRTCILMPTSAEPPEPGLSLPTPIRSVTDLLKLPAWPFVTFGADEQHWVFQHFYPPR